MESKESTNKVAGGTSWFAVQVKTTHEKRVTSLLDYKGHEWFLPLYTARRRWSDRIKRVEIPLFPGYVFSRFAPPARVSILKTPSVLRIAGIGNTPMPIDDHEIAALQRMVHAGAGLSPHRIMKEGQWVGIETGSLYG